MGQKGHIMVQKGLKMHKKFLDLKNLLFSGIFLSGIVVPPPLNGQSLCSKNLSGKGGFFPAVFSSAPNNQGRFPLEPSYTWSHLRCGNDQHRRE